MKRLACWGLSACAITILPVLLAAIAQAQQLPVAITNVWVGQLDDEQETAVLETLFGE